MAEMIDNYNGFKVIRMNNKEADSISFGIKGQCICDNCNRIIKDGDIHYIAVLNETFCKVCCDNITNSIRHFEDDYEYENRYYNHYAKRLHVV